MFDRVRLASARLVLALGCAIAAADAASFAATPTLTTQGTPTLQFVQSSSNVTEAAGVHALALQLSAASASAISVPFSMSGSATDGSDYTVVASPLVIPAGMTTASIDVTLIDDVLVEGREGLTVSLGAPTGATLGAATQHRVTIADNEPAATVTFLTTASSVGEDESSIDVTVQLSSPLTESVSVDFTRVGTALYGVDYTCTASPLAIFGGSTSASITISPIDDGSDEPTETIVLDLGSVDNAVLGALTHHDVSLTDDDLPPNIRFRTVASQLSELGGPLAVAVDLSEASGFDVMAVVTTSGTATSGVDYTWSGSPITIPAGAVSTNLTVTPIDDTLLEGIETATFTLSAPTHATLGSRPAHDVVILDNESVPTVQFVNAAASSPESAGVVNVELSLSHAPATQVSVPFTLGGTASEPVDYTASASPLVIPVGATSASIQLTLVEDLIPESTETVILTLGAPTGATLGAVAQHTRSILDNDTSVTVAFALASQAGGEGAGLVAVSVQLSAASAANVTVPYTFSGSATAADFTAPPSPLVIPAGSTSGALDITLVQDTLYEGPETLVVTLGSPTGATLGAVTQHSLAITDDDPMPSAGFTLFRTAVQESSGGFLFRLQLSAVSGLPATIPFTISGPASGPGDIVAPVSPAVIPAGQAFVDVPVGLIVDRFPEPGETVTFQLAPPLTGATPGATSSLLVAIIDGAAGPVATPPALTATPSVVTFPQGRALQPSGVSQVVLTNVHSAPITFLGLEPESGHIAAFGVTYPNGAPPIVLAPAQSVAVDVSFLPLNAGPRSATFVVRQGFGGFPPGRVTFEGIALGVPGSDIVLNAGGQSYVGQQRVHWCEGYGEVLSEGEIASVVPVAGTNDDPLYQFSRWGQIIQYDFPLPDGAYDLRVHSWEPIYSTAGARVFDVKAEGQVIFDDVDPAAAVGPQTAWISPVVRVQIADGVLDLDLEASIGRAIISALEVRAVAEISSPTTLLQFGTVDQGSFGQLAVELVNTGPVDGRLSSVQIAPGVSGPASEFAVQVGATLLPGGAGLVNHPVDLTLPAGQSVFVPVIFTPTLHRDNDLTLRFNAASGESLYVNVRGTGGANLGWGFLHPVIAQAPALAIDYDGSGAEVVNLIGSGSHTHEPGRALTGFEWRVNGAVVGTTVDTTATLAVGQSTVALKISDNNLPPAEATDSTQISVFSPSGVPGVLAQYYDGAALGELFLLDNVPTRPNFIARQTGLRTEQVAGKIGASPYATHAMVRWDAQFTLASATTLTFTAAGGDGRRVLVDGALVSAPVALAAGNHTLVVRFAASDTGDLPLTLDVTSGGTPVPGFESALIHAEGQLLPVIHTMPTQGTDLGGNDIVIAGFGFFPKAQVVVNWGGTPITQAQFVEYSPERIRLVSPPGSGSRQVSVTTPNGTSNEFTFVYSPSGPIPVRWTLLADRQLTLNDPTRAIWGPDGRLWVALINGTLRAVTYDDDWNVTNTQYYVGVSGRTNKDILGLAFNPFDVYDPSTPSSLKIYVAHGELWQNGGGAFSGPSDFTGEVSVLSGPSFNAATSVVSGLPVSNHDHGINGLVFDGNGDLLIACGGTSNAGVTHAAMGDIPESPLTGAILRAFTSRPNFNGQIAYVDRQTQAVIADQVLGGNAILAPGVDVEVYAPGFRNAFDIALHTNGYLYATDNGPNDGFGPASTGPATQGGSPHPFTADELLLVEYGNYYGHPNRSRGLDDPRQNIYWNDVAPSLPHQFTQAISRLTNSTDGLEEYRATAFNSQIRGQLVAMQWQYPASGIRLIELGSNGRSVVNPFGTATSPANSGLDVATAPGGALIAVDYLLDRVRVQIPDDVGAVGLTPYDVFPARGRSTGGVPFVLGGLGFGTLANTSVTFDGVPAVVTSVTSKRIRGVVPARPSGAVGFVNVGVTVSGSTVIIPAGFQYLPAVPGQMPGTWRSGTALPVALGEVASAELNGMIYVFGQGDSRTFRFDVLNGTWNTTLDPRPFAGNHHGCEVWNGRVYLIGGLDNSSGGRVQIFDPASNHWTQGAQMPWAGGSVITALIDGKIYAAGGIVGSSTVSNLAVYDLALNTWTSLAPMPLGVNHAAAATDGQRLFIFGGRQGPNIPQPGFSNVQIYDPTTMTWLTSQAAQVAPMPLPRGGTGRAVWYRGEFYVFGGEDNSVAFDDVQAYNPVTNTWRQDARMPSRRHGIFPVKFQDRVFVMGGGIVAGFGISTIVEVFQRP